ncbi:GNAT family N-acetyltransferase [Citromicrobium bathyomarinum]
MTGGDGAQMQIAPMEPGDIPEALAIQSQAYPASLQEDAPVFAARLALSPSFCFTARRAGAMAGYLIAHGWERANPPAIGTLTGPAGASEVLYIHDLAIAPGARGLRLGERLVARAFDAARASGLCEAELVAVEGAHSFWHQLGFREGHSAAIAAKLASYGADARWMRLEGLAAG